MDKADRAARGHAFQRILVGYDGSRAAQDALRVALELGNEVGGQVRVLLVVRPPAHVETPDELAAAEAAERDSLSRGLGDVLEPGGGGPPDVRVVVADDAARAIAEHAEVHGFDLVVLGDHGREHTTHRGVGQSVEVLLRHHPCPLLVV